MTPFGLTLQHRLEKETRRMENEWFFKWHYIGKDGPVEIDSFDGKMLKYGGIGYSGTAREVFWDTLKRYISGKIDDIFVELEAVLTKYPIEMSEQTIDDTKNLLMSFNGQIADIAVEKDKILRGNGFEFPPPDRGRASGVLQANSITLRANALADVVKLKLAASATTDGSGRNDASHAEPIREGKSMSFREFKDDLLIAIAIQAKGESTADLVPLDVAKARGLSYRNGWLRQAVELLHYQGLIKASFHLGGGEDGGMNVQIIGSGLEAAEELCDERGSDLYEEIDEQSGASGVSESATVPASDRIVKIDHNSAQYMEIIGKLAQISDAAKKSNSLSIENADERDQRLAEITAGKILLEAPRTNAEKVKSLLIDGLKWIGEKIADNVVSVIVTGLIGLVLALLGFV
jgi:hypothetical protein